MPLCALVRDSFGHGASDQPVSVYSCARSLEQMPGGQEQTCPRLRGAISSWFDVVPASATIEISQVKGVESLVLAVCVSESMLGKSLTCSEKLETVSAIFPC